MPLHRLYQDRLGGDGCRWRGACAHARGGAAVGAPVERLDGLAKVRGTEVYGADFAPADALLVRAVRSPHFAAAFSFGDLEGWASAQAGPVQVFTAADIPGRNLFSTIPTFVDQPALAETHVRMRGEAVALVAGPPDVVEALDLDRFPVTWVPEAEMLDTDAARAGDAVKVHESRDGNILIAGLVRTGDADAALAASAHVAEAAVETAYVEHAYIEP